MRVTHASLFTGIGGFDLAAEWMGWKNVFQVEIDPFCNKVLEKNFPHAKRYGDIKQFDGKPYRGAIDVLTGGFPCQPHSFAGSRKQKDDKRHLWPEMLRVIGEVKPKYVIGENVSGIFNLVDEICSDLESEGYTVEPIGIEASCIGTDNLRERYWFVAYSASVGWENVCDEFTELPQKARDTERTRKRSEQREQEAIVMDPLGNPFLQFEERFGEPAIFGEYDGLPKRLDVCNRLTAIGNAIDPRVVHEIFKALNL